METVLIGTKAFVVVPCASCGVDFAIPQVMEDARRGNGEAFYCPNGHNLSYKATYQQTIASLRKDVAEAITARDALEAKLARVQNGVCPECRRSFKDLHRHMKTKHTPKEARAKPRRTLANRS